jgi:eukaryotic-like serine/threonine-protein kinase
MENYEFGPFRLEIATRSLFRAGEFIPLPPKVAETLLLLVEEAGRVVTKEQLLARVWPGVVVEEGGIASNVSALRKVFDGEFGDDGPIATVARRGYRFTAEVRRGANGADASAGNAPASKPRVLHITDRDTILVADIENRTGDPVFDGTIKQALLLHLAQSPYFEVLTDRRVHSMLASIGKGGQPVVADVALEVCQRSGSKVAIAGSIFSLGDEIVIGLQALEGESGDILVTQQARARGKGDVLRALDEAAIGMREQLGESLTSVRQHSQAFDEVVTSSLEALKAYTLARTQWFTHGEQAAVPHFLRAIELDNEFVSAYSGLSLCYSNSGEAARAATCAQRAFDRRDRATERERLRVLAVYHHIVTGDCQKSLDACRAQLAKYPRDSGAAINTGNHYALIGQWDKGLIASMRGMELETTNISVSNVAIALMALGRREEARALLDLGFARGWEGLVHLDGYQEAFLRGDAEGMKRHVDAVMGRMGDEDFLIACEADTEAFHGRFVRAREFSRRAVASARRAGSDEMAGTWEAQCAYREAEVGRRDLAVQGATAALELSDGYAVQWMAGFALARAGALNRAGEIVATLEKDRPQDTIIQGYWLPCMRAAMAMERKDWHGALQILEPAAVIELALCFPFEGGFMIPAYLRGLAYFGCGRGADAAREFKKIIDRPGLVKNFVTYSLALRGLGRCGTETSVAAKKRFESLWANADAELLVIPT